MTILEIILIIIGLFFIFGSFMVSEKLSPKDIEHLSKVTRDGMNDIVNKGLENARQKIDETIDDAISESAEKASRQMEKESNDKVMNIKEYSEGVLDDMHKAHDEVMFLYDMLSGKQEELEKSISQAKQLDKGLLESAKSIKEDGGSPEKSSVSQGKVSPGIFEREAHVVDVSNELEQLSSNAFSAEIDETEKEPVKKEEPVLNTQIKTEQYDERDNNAKIIDYHKRGWSEKDIAIALGVGMGEVRLAINLYESRK